MTCNLKAALKAFFAGLEEPWHTNRADSISPGISSLRFHLFCLFGHVIDFIRRSSISTSPASTFISCIVSFSWFCQFLRILPKALDDSDAERNAGEDEIFCDEDGPHEDSVHDRLHDSIKAVSASEPPLGERRPSTPPLVPVSDDETWGPWRPKKGNQVEEILDPSSSDTEIVVTTVPKIMLRPKILAKPMPRPRSVRASGCVCV